MSTWIQVAEWADEAGRTLTLFTTKDDLAVRLTVDSTSIRHDVDIPASIASEVGEKMARSADHLLLRQQQARQP